MQSLAALFRALHLYAHEAHHSCKGPTFFADHGFLEELYEAYLDAYDLVVERLLGLGLPDFSEKEASRQAFERYESMTSKEWFPALLSHERMLQKEIAAANEGATLGTQNLLQGLADESEARCYKIQQRIR